MKFSRILLAKLLRRPLGEVLTYQSVERHDDGRISFRRRIDRDVWEFCILPAYQ